MNGKEYNITIEYDEFFKTEYGHFQLDPTERPGVFPILIQTKLGIRPFNYSFTFEAIGALITTDQLSQVIWIVGGGE